LSSCRNDGYFIKGEGSNITQDRYPGDFAAVSLSIPANVEIYYDTVCSVEIDAQPNILNVIETRVSGDHLSIRLTSGTSIRKHNPIRVILRTDKIRSL